MTFAEKLRIIKSGQIIRQLVCWGIFTEHQIRERKMWWMRCWQFSVIEMPSCRKRSWNMLRQQSIIFTETDYKERRT